MPSATAPSNPSTARRSWWRSGLRASWLLLRVVIVIFAVLLLGVRFIALPQLEHNRDELSRLLSRQIGQPVEIGSLDTGWDGWNPRIDIQGFRLLDRENGSAVVSLPHVRLVVAWTSFVALDLRLKELTIDGPQLALRRDLSGILHVAGLTIDPLGPRSDQRLTNWLMRQPSIFVHNAEFAWRDEHAGGSELVLSRVELRLENRFGHHRFGLTGAPPPELAAPLDLRGEFTGTSFADARALSGRAYARLDYADIAAWREWLPMSIPIRSGKGAIRVWLELAQGELRDLIADVVLADVEARLAPDLPELALSGLEGRLGWSHDGKQSEFYTQHLTFAASNGVRFDPTDFKLIVRSGTDAMANGQIEFTRLELTPLREIAVFLPLPAKWRENLARIAPSGTLELGALQWHGDPEELQAFSGSGHFVDLGFAAQGQMPGVTGITGDFDASPEGGTLKFQSQAMTLDLPRALSEKMSFDSVQAQVRWHHEKSGMSVDVDQLAFANQDLAGTAKGSYTPAADGRGRFNMTGQVARVDAVQLHRYLPLAIDVELREWMHRAVLAGTASDVRLKLVGAPADFPFADAKLGQFQVQAKAQGLTLDYVRGWPEVHDLDGDIRVDGARLTVDVRQGRVYGAEIGRSRIDIADLRSANPMLHLEGVASGPSSDFVRYIADSPLDVSLDHPTAGVDVSGSGKLALKLDLPLGKAEAIKVAGDYTLDNGRIKFAEGTPPLERLSGKILFTGHDVNAPALSGELLGGPAQFSIATVDSRLRVDGQGSMNLALLRSEYPKQSLITRFSGTTDWKVAINAQPGGMAWVMDSSLKGATVDLPAPAGKSAAESIALRVERRVNEPGRDVLIASYGKLATFTVERRLAPTGTIAERALLALGSAAPEPDRRGFWIRGDIGALDADAWLLLKEQLDTGASQEDMPLAGVDVSIGALSVFGRAFKALRIGATRQAGEWQIDLQGRELLGNARWQAAATGRPNGRLVARLQRVVTPTAASTAIGAPWQKVDAPPAANPWPALDVIADSFTIRNHELGKLEMVAQPHEADWQIESLKLSADDGTLTATGWWRNTRSAQQTDLEVNLDVRDAGKYLGRFGMPGALHGAPTTLHGQLAWAGSPQDFDYPTLSGAFSIETGRGQFSKLDPGIGKLLGVLSLQAFKRRLEGDYQDLFGEGFAFDEITGNVRIKDGVMRTDDLKIVGPSARVTITGDADIARETQKLSVRVQPTLSASVSVGAAALLLANPIIGAAIGAGTLLAQKIMQDPIEQMFSQRYMVTGSWSDPQVERGSGVATTAGPLESGR
jgi:uncharacterized protein (TIGR02099 family)